MYQFSEYGMLFISERYYWKGIRLLKEKNNPDAPGYFINWLYDRVDTYGYKFSGWWFDIGTPEDYKMVNKKFKDLK